MGSTVISHVLSRNPVGIRFSRKSWNRSNNEREIERAPFASEFRDNYQISTYVILIRNERLLASLVVLGTHRLGWSLMATSVPLFRGPDSDGPLRQHRDKSNHDLGFCLLNLWGIA